MSKTKFETGATLIECLVALVISLIITAALGSNFNNQIKHYYNLKNKLLTEENFINLAKVSEQIMHDFDTHALELFPLVHPAGYVRLHNGEALSVSNLSIDSTAISTIRLLYDQLLILNDSIIEFGQIKTLACHKYTEIPKVPLTELRQVLLIHPEFVSEAKASFIFLPAQPNCYEITLTPEQGLFSSEQGLEKLILANHAVPIEWIRTYYRTNQNNLRVMGHVGRQIIFSQPVYDNVPNFTYELESTQLQGHIQLKLTLQSSLKTDPLILQQRVPRASLLNLTANL